MQDGIWIIDNKGVTVLANARMAEILGTSVPILLGKHSFDYVYPEDLDAAKRLFERKQQGDFESFTFRLRRSDGTPINTMIQGTPRYDANGDFLGIVGTFRVVED